MRCSGSTVAPCTDSPIGCRGRWMRHGWYRCPRIPTASCIGVEDGPGVRIVSEDELQRVRDDLHTTLGAPAHKLTPKGTIEVWTLSRDPHVTVTYRPFSKSGGPTIDFNGVESLDVKRLHIPYEGGEK